MHFTNYYWVRGFLYRSTATCVDVYTGEMGLGAWHRADAASSEALDGDTSFADVREPPVAEWTPCDCPLEPVEYD